MKKQTCFCLLALTLLPLFIAWKEKQLPTCFLLGDSISVHYAPYLEVFLKDVVTIERKGTDQDALKNLDIPAGASGGDSRMVLDYLQVIKDDPAFHPDFFLFNFGLHDVKHNPPKGRIQVPVSDYRNNLKSVIHLLKEKGVKPIWIRTTPVVDSIHNKRQPSFKRYANDVETYNKVADSICNTEGVPIIDLYNFTLTKVPEHYIDHVHYDEETRALQAAFLAGAIQQCLVHYESVSAMKKNLE